MGLCLSAPVVEPERQTIEPKELNNRRSMDPQPQEPDPTGIPMSDFTPETSGKISDVYDLKKQVLGEGSYGSVSLGIHKKTKASRAVKTMSKAEVKNVVRFESEISIMKSMDHPNIIRLFDSFQDHRNIYLVMEFCAGGELFDRIIGAGHFTETQAALLVDQIVRPIRYMHSQRVAHRDLKPENFTFVSNEPIDKTCLKLIDFGFACRFEPDKALTTKAGTPYYVAPQVLLGRYDQLCDVWSIGVIIYVMLCGYPPFGGQTDSQVLANVRRGNFAFPPAEWTNVSEPAKDLIRNLLKFEPRNRLSAEGALNHTWLKNEGPKSTGSNLKGNFVSNLRAFHSQNKFKQTALHVMASQLNEDQIKALRDTFTALDANGDGLLSPGEMKDGLSKAGWKEIPTDLQQLLDSVDSNLSGSIDYSEFMAATLSKRQFMKESVCWSAFQVFDKNGDGQITAQEFANVLNELKEDSQMKEIASIVQKYDKNQDGTISFDEFMAMMKHSM